MQRRIVFLLAQVIIILLSCKITKKNTYKGQSKNIVFNSKILPLPPRLYDSYEEWLKEVPKVKDILIKSGSIETKGLICKVYIEDKNKNNFYQDPEDIVGISSIDQNFVARFNAYSYVAKYKDTLFCQFNETKFLLYGLDKEGTNINFVLFPFNQKPDILLYEGFPYNWSYEAVIEKGQTALFKEAINLEKKYIYLNFWATYCPPCIEEIPTINLLLEKNINVINLCATYGVENAQNLIKEKKFLGAHGILTEEMGRNFCQRPKGFPFGILYDTQSGKIIKNNIKPKDVLKYIQ